ncbi:MBL fold metallo-hydrolase [bacterium]|nr:MBL fold metallo-hydrolase [bacterium]
MVHFEYYAHSCFLFHFGSTKILIDPYSPEIGYKMPERGADYVWVSHSHYDHSNIAGVSGRATVIRGCAPRTLGPVTSYGVLADHDGQGGANKGHVTVLCFQNRSQRYCHLADLGQRLSPEQVQEIGTCDVVMVPVGGGDCTLNAAQALEVLAQLKPQLILPMHYRTPFLSRARFPTIDSLEPFLSKASGHYAVEKVNDGVVKMDNLPARPTILVVPHLY